MRDAAINLRALPQQRDLIDQAAQLLGKNRSDFMLEAACDKAQAVLLDQVRHQAERRSDVLLGGVPPAADVLGRGERRGPGPLEERHRPCLPDAQRTVPGA